MIIGIGTWRGSGATTTALALAGSLAQHASPGWLIEADPAGGVIGARLGLDTDRWVIDGLERLAFPAAIDDSTMWWQTPGASARFDSVAVTHHGVRMVLAPGDPFRAWSCHRPRSNWAASLRDLDLHRSGTLAHTPSGSTADSTTGSTTGSADRAASSTVNRTATDGFTDGSGGDVVVDLGRLRANGPIDAVLEQLDLLLVISSNDIVSLATTLEWAEARGKVSPHDAGLPADITRIVVAETPGATERVSRAGIEAELADRFAGWLPWSPSAAEALNRGTAVTNRRLRTDPFVQAVDHLAGRCRHWSQHAAPRVELSVG